MSNSELTPLGALFIIFLACMAIGIIWIIASIAGPIAPQYWLLIIGFIGVVIIYVLINVFAKASEG
ncbi:hypothetical protein ES706_00745 [subsurface metagenome]|nr:hypothetical protein [Hadesarchaea archaeon]